MKHQYMEVSLCGLIARLRRKKSGTTTTATTKTACTVSLVRETGQGGSSGTEGVKKKHRIRRGGNYTYSMEQRCGIAMYAAKYGNTKTKMKYSNELGFNIPESTIRTFKKKYLLG